MRRAGVVRTRIVAAGAALATATLALGSVTFGATLVGANGPVVTGAGSTWVQIAMTQWAADEALAGIHIDYTSVGSSAGRSAFINKQDDFAATEIPFQPGQEIQALQASGRSFQYVPDVAGGTSLMYNLHAPDGSRITTLRLDPNTLAGIFTGTITQWNDPAIRGLNPGLSISDNPPGSGNYAIIPVVRSDGSGTSAQFSLYLANQAAGVWNSFASKAGCDAPCSQWPTTDLNGNQFPFQAETGSDGVANFVENNQIGAGSIGYMEAGFAFARAFPIVRLKNASGNFVPQDVDQQKGPLAFSNDVATALQHATLNADLTQNLTGVYAAPEANAYPMSSYSYMITQTSGFDPAKGAVLGAFMIYYACGGQAEATQLGYSPMPPNLVADVFDAVHRIPGSPPTPPLDYAHCPNPRFVNSLGGGGGGFGVHHGGSGGANGSGGNGAAATAGATPAASTSSALAAGGATPVATLSPAEREVAFVQAEQETARLSTQPSLPLLVAGGAVLLLVFFPALWVSWRAR